MKPPYFSIGLPTRNRGELAEQVIRYVLAQTFQDFELIIADSDDTDETRERVKKFNDPRIRYHCTRGKTGPDNFQFCADEARGEYFMMLTDRLVLRPYALEVLHQSSQGGRYSAMRYHFDTYDDRSGTPKTWSPEYCTGENKVYSADEILRQFADGVPNEYFYRVVPTPQYSAIHRSVLEKIRGTGVNPRPFFAPIVPDMWFIFAQLSCCEDPILNVGRSLSVFLIKDGVYFSFLLKKDSGLKFLREICKGDELEMNHVPVKAHTIDNMIYNDYGRAQKIYGGRLLNYPLPPATYFVGVHRNMQDSIKAGVNMRKDHDAWAKALAKQPADVQAEVAKRLGAKSSFAKLETKRLMKKARSALGLVHIEDTLRSLKGRKRKKKAVAFKTVAEYMAASR
jgi:glycosyltransferase involved in cell wall biosynthesis